MTTRVYGHSDDLIEFEGDVRGEVGCYGADDDDSRGVLCVFSDGTVLSVKYGKGGAGVWSIAVIRKGELFDRIDQCVDEDADPYSDQAFFKDGLTWAKAAKEWEKVR